jgi:hypothetical protein
MAGNIESMWFRPLASRTYGIMMHESIKVREILNREKAELHAEIERLQAALEWVYEYSNDPSVVRMVDFALGKKMEKCNE